MGFQQILENAVSEKFNINKCTTNEGYRALEGSLTDSARPHFESMKQKLEEHQFKAFLCGMVRNCFLIELVNAEVKSTKMQTRWSECLEHDVRFSSYETCMLIFEKILSKIDSLSATEFVILKEFFVNTVIPYEMPIDYVDRRANPIHSVTNVDLFIDEDISACTKIRQFMRDNKDNPEVEVFQKILKKKVKVKAYLTDRAQTGDYKSNREKRWEAHPNSVQYALRRNCMCIETKLLCQIAMFEGCDRALVASLQEAELLPPTFSFIKCPITGENIQYSEFSADALNPQQGESAFHVGHLHPLKSLDEANFHGHTADNISWISKDGNRIQGSLSMEEVNELLRRIYINRPELRE